LGRQDPAFREVVFRRGVLNVKLDDDDEEAWNSTKTMKNGAPILT
jgi:hypothetical protein